MPVITSPSHSKLWKALHCLQQCSSNFAKIEGFFFSDEILHGTPNMARNRSKTVSLSRWQSLGEGTGRVRDPKYCSLLPWPTYPLPRRLLIAAHCLRLLFKCTDRATREYAKLSVPHSKVPVIWPWLPFHLLSHYLPEPQLSTQCLFMLFHFSSCSSNTS